MPSLHRFPPYIIAAAVLFMITFYHVYNVRSENSDLERNVKVLKEALSVSKEKNKVLVKDAMEKVAAKDARIQQLEQENLAKHTKLGETQAALAKMKSNLESKKDEIEKLHQLAADLRAEISALTKSVGKSKEVLTKLSAKADHLMSDHKKLKKENAKLQQENEKLQNDIKQHQSLRETLNEQINTLKKEKEDLGIKVDDLTRKNEVIQEGIKQKIKESYAARREMNQVRPAKETEDRRPRQKTQITTQDSLHKTVSAGQKDPKIPQRLFKISEEDQVPILNNANNKPSNLMNITTDSILNQNAVLKAMVHSSNAGSKSKVIADSANDSRNTSRIKMNNSDGTQNNVSRILVDNHAENRRKWDTISVGTNGVTDVKNNLADKEESLNDVRSRPLVSSDDQSLQRESRFSLADFKSRKDSENVDQEKNDEENFEKTENGNKKEEDFDESKDENLQRMANGNMDGKGVDKNEEQSFETEEENGNTKRESPNEEKDEDNFHEMRTGRDPLPVLPDIKDEMMNRQTPNVYGDHLQDSSKQNAESFDQKDS